MSETKLTDEQAERIAEADGFTRETDANIRRGAGREFWRAFQVCRAIESEAAQMPAIPVHAMNGQPLAGCQCGNCKPAPHRSRPELVAEGARKQQEQGQQPRVGKAGQDDANEAISLIRDNYNSAKKFWSRIDDSHGPDACWPWTGEIGQDGYGRFHMRRDGRDIKLTANRAALELALNRPLAAGMVAMHSCDNPRCCNPRHLSEGTHADNRRDAMEKGRLTNRQKPARAKLSDADVVRMRELKAAGIGVRPLAAQFGVAQSTVRHIICGEARALAGGPICRRPEGGAL